MRPFGNPCVVWQERIVNGKVKDAGVKGIMIGYGYVNRKKGYRVRIDGTNNVVTRVDVGFCVFPPSAAEVNVLPTRESGSEALTATELERFCC